MSNPSPQTGLSEAERDGIFARIRDRIAGYVASNSGAKSYAEDLAQETIIILLNDRYRDLPESDLTNVAYHVARWKILGWLRLRDTQTNAKAVDFSEQIPDSSANHAALAEERDLLNRMAAVIRTQMGEPCRTLLNMYLKEIGGEKMASAIGRTEDGMWAQLKRCKEKLVKIIRLELEGHTA